MYTFLLNFKGQTIPIVFVSELLRLSVALHIDGRLPANWRSSSSWILVHTRQQHLMITLHPRDDAKLSHCNVNRSRSQVPHVVDPVSVTPAIAPPRGT